MLNNIDKIKANPHDSNMPIEVRYAKKKTNINLDMLKITVSLTTIYFALLRARNMLLNNGFRAEKTTKIIIEAAKLAGQRLVLSSGWAKLGKDKLVDKDCYIIGKISHNFLFPKMAAIIHHGGSGTTATAARAGKPQIIVPHMTDQFYFAEQVPKTGVAPESIWRKKLTPQNLASAIRKVVTSKEMKKKSETLSNSLLNQDSFKLAEKYIKENFMN